MHKQSNKAEIDEMDEIEQHFDEGQNEISLAHGNDENIYSNKTGASSFGKRYFPISNLCSFKMNIVFTFCCPSDVLNIDLNLTET